MASELKQCECNLCKRGRKVRQCIAYMVGCGLQEEAEFVQDLEEQLAETEMDLCYAEMIIDGTWQDADKVIKFRREKVSER